jgi:hypothetical protein
MTDSDDLLNTLQKLEVELHDPSARASERAAQLLGESFVEFGSSGQVYSRAEILVLLASEAPPEISSSQFSVQRIAQDAALLTYVSCHHSSQDTFSLRSSIWQFQEEQWRIIFHQGTKCAQSVAQG